MRSAWHGAMSLIEMLVAIVVLAVLFALLFSAVRTPYERAQAAKCMSNLHSIGSALALFIQDNGRYPGAMTGISGMTYWHQALEQYMGTKKGNQNTDFSPYFQCPAKDAPAGDQMLGYGWNYLGFGHWPESSGQWESNDYMAQYWGVSPEKIENWGAIVIGDNRDVGMGGSPVFIYNSTGAATAYAQRHYGGGNYLFADGHVEWLDAAGLVERVKQRGPDGKIKWIMRPF